MARLVSPHEAELERRTAHRTLEAYQFFLNTLNDLEYALSPNDPIDLLEHVDQFFAEVDNATLLSDADINRFIALCVPEDI